MIPAIKAAAAAYNRLVGPLAPRVGPAGRLDPLFTVGRFVREHGRWPRDPARDDAGLMDYLFWRKHRPWSALAMRCCDKGLAKIEAARLAPAMKVPRTVARIEVVGLADGTALERELAPYFGRKLVAKLAHGNGGIIFLETVAGLDWDAYLSNARLDFYRVARERQYRGLAPNIIVEEMLAGDGDEPPSDYKFFCFGGRPVLCQVDSDRFSGHKRELFLIPDWLPLQVEYSFPAPPVPTHRPPLIAEAMTAAVQLATPFDFVRVDLYLTDRKIYFGEFTFTPDAGLKRFDPDAFDRALGGLLKSGSINNLRQFVRPT